MLRNRWKSRHTARQLAEAAQAKIAFHPGCLDFWVARRKEMIGEIKADGIEVSEKTVFQFGRPQARDFQQGGGIAIRNGLRKSPAASYEKLACQTGRRDTCDGWRQVSRANADDAIELAIDDRLIFFGQDTGKDGQ